MKKKFLSLMMAAAVVATTSVSAFASTTQTIKDSEEVGGQAQITVTGDVEDSTGHTNRYIKCNSTNSSEFYC
ncbi:MAG: hypothetical protein V8R03_09155 [Clostridium sp.]